MNSSELIKANNKSLCYGGNEYIKDEEYLSEFKNETDMEISIDCSELSAKASSSSMQESMTNISNSHSTPEDNFSENALMSPITKYSLKTDDIVKETNLSPPIQYYNGENEKISSNNQSIDDTIESVLNKYRVDSQLTNKSNILTSSFPTEKSKSSNSNNKLNSTQNNNHVQNHKTESFNQTMTNTHNYQQLPYPVNYANGYSNYRGYYQNSHMMNPHSPVPVPYPMYNRGNEQNRYYYNYYPPYTQYRPYYQPYPYHNQLYPYPNHANYSMYHRGQLKPPNYDQYHQNIDEYPTGYANFKIPHSSANNTAEQPGVPRKKRQHDSKSQSQSKRRKVSQNVSGNPPLSNYDELLCKLRIPNFTSLISSPKLAMSPILLPPVGYVDDSPRYSSRVMNFQKYKSHIYSLKRKRPLDIKKDKYLKKFIEEPPSDKLLQVNKQRQDDESCLDIVPSSPVAKAPMDSLLKNISFTIPTNETSRSRSPELTKLEPKHLVSTKPSESFRLPDNLKTANSLNKIQPNDFKVPILSCTENETKIIREVCEQIPNKESLGHCYTQLNGTFLKRTKINGKTFSNVHIEEAVSIQTIMSMKSVTCCSNCCSILNSIYIIKRKDTDLGLESKSDEFSFCTEICLNEFKHKCINDPSKIDRKTILNPVQLQQTQVVLKNSQISTKNSKGSSKKACDFEHYVRRRFPSETQNGNDDSCSRNSQFSFTFPLSDYKFKCRDSKFLIFNSEKLKPIIKPINKVDQSFILSKYSNYFRNSEGLNDQRTCILCHTVGDADENVCGRLINIDLDNWIHMNCALWCFEVYETVSGCLMEVAPSIEKALKTPCVHCNELGAGIQCYRSKCQAIYHVPCAHKIGCVFYTDRGMYCSQHAVLNHPMLLTTLYAADRRVIVYRDESDLVASTQSFIGTPDDITKPIFRSGSLILNNIGQLLPEQLRSGRYNSSSIIYPIGFHSTRIYWSFNHLNKRCRYECHIIEQDNAPAFKIFVNEVDDSHYEFIETCCDKIWRSILDKIAKLRQDAGLTKLFPSFLSGEQLFGLTEPHIIRVIESLPGVDMIPNYAFKFGKMQLITEMPLAVNPTGSARTEPKLRTYVRRRQNFQNTEQPSANNNTGLSQCSILKTKQLFHPQFDSSSKAQSHSSRLLQYKKMKLEWMDNVILSRSKIQGLGLFAARDLDKSQIIIEYIGELIRSEVGNRREKAYEARNDSIYMFRLNEDMIIDATRNGGLARYINHSCSPNCVAELLQTDIGDCIVITTKQKIGRGEELSYDYKFDFEEDLGSARIPCLCGSVNCRKWMN